MQPRVLAGKSGAKPATKPSAAPPPKKPAAVLARKG